jgi:hypothetical protein
MPDPEEKVGTPGGARSGGMQPQQEEANKYDKARASERQAAIDKLAKQFAPKDKATLLSSSRRKIAADPNARGHLCPKPD